MILETNNKFTKILETINDKPISLKNKSLVDLNFKK